MGHRRKRIRGRRKKRIDRPQVCPSCGAPCSSVQCPLCSPGASENYTVVEGPDSQTLKGSAMVTGELRVKRAPSPEIGGKDSTGFELGVGELGVDSF